MTAGNRDPTFGLFGMTGADFGGGGAEANALAIQPDGKILAAGFANHAGVSALAIARFQPSGLLDLSFGGGPGLVPGELRIVLARGPSRALSMALQPDGKIVVGGRIDVGGGDTIMFVVRLLPSGVLDLGFGIRGSVLVESLRHSEVNGLVITRDAKIIAVGPSVLDRLLAFTLVGLRSDGTMDPSFGAAGIVRTGVGLPSTALGPVPFAAVDQAFGIVVGGRSIFGSGTTGRLLPAFIRYKMDGSIDPSFGDHGIVSIDGRRAQCAAVAVSANFYVLGAGDTSDASTEFLAVVLDPRTGHPIFPHGPSVTTSFRDLGFSAASARGCAVHNDRQAERWLLAGTVSDGAKRNIALARYQFDGSLDHSFAGGRVVTDFLTGPSEAAALAVQHADRKIVVAGNADFGGARIFALVRYLGL